MAEARYRVTLIGDEREPVVVFDALAGDAAAAIARAAPLAPDRGNYPGSRAPAGADYCRLVAPALAAAVRDVFGYREHLAFERAMVSLAHTAPADLSLAQRVPHIDDPAPDRLAAVHYLSRGGDGGTAFFRHRSTGLARIGPERHRTYLDALRDDFARSGPPAAGYIDGPTALFEEVHRVEPAFGRAVLYRSSLLHSAALPNDRVLPADAATGRLTIASFLRAR